MKKIISGSLFTILALTNINGNAQILPPHAIPTIEQLADEIMNYNEAKFQADDKIRVILRLKDKSNAYNDQNHSFIINGNSKKNFLFRSKQLDSYEITTEANPEKNFSKPLGSEIVLRLSPIPGKIIADMEILHREVEYKISTIPSYNTRIEIPINTKIEIPIIVRKNYYKTFSIPVEKTIKMEISPDITVNITTKIIK